MRFNVTSSLTALVAAIAVAFTLAVAGGEGQPVAHAASGEAEYLSGQLIVTFDDGADAYTAVATVEGSSVKRISSNGGFASVSVPVGAEDEYAARLSGVEGVATAERNPLAQPAFIPDDEFYDLQWHLPMIQAEAAWNVSMGEGVVVAVLDTGIAFEDWDNGVTEFAKAPDFADTEFVHPYDATFGDQHPNDDDGHGSHVAGTIAQTTDNEIGTAGVAPQAQLMPVKVCTFIGCPGYAIADGVVWAVDHGADAINMSLGGFSISQAERDALQYAEDNGVLVVAAAGNGGSDKQGDPTLDYPAAVDTVFSVGALRYDMEKAPYSNYGGGDTVGIDIVAPGGDHSVDQNGDGFKDGVLQNTFAYLCGPASFGDFTRFDYCYYQGTSMATPHVAGTAALLLSVSPDLTPQQVREVLRCSAYDLGEPGYDDVFGAGLVQAADALRDSDKDGTVDCLDETPDPVPPLVSIDSADVATGEEVTVAIEAEVDAPGLAAYAIDVSFDPAVVEPTGCVAPAGGICNPAYGPGIVRVNGIAMPPIEGPVTLAEITFRAVAEDRASTPLDVQLVDFADDDLKDLKPDTVVVDGEIVVEAGPQTRLGDVDCDDDVDILDVLGVLQHQAALATPDCIDEAGDVDCDGDVDLLDALKIALFLVALPYEQPSGCPPIGEVA